MSRTSPDVPGTWEHGDPGTPIERPWKANEIGYMNEIGLRAKRYSMGGTNILVSREPVRADGALMWHLSISRPNRHPSWDDIKAARYRLLPLDLTFAIILPPPDQYTNVEAQDHVFHLWEVET
jgi:hypothetical protein